MGRQNVDKNAPKKPLSGFFLFSKHMREIKPELSSMSFTEYNRYLSREWSNLTVETKQSYLTEAGQQREAYKQAWQAYITTDSYKQWQATAKATDDKAGKQTKKKKNKRAVELPTSAAAAAKTVKVNSNTIDLLPPEAKIPIFTSDFLAYNRQREQVLRQLKKQTGQLEEETALQSKHVDALSNAESRVEGQTKVIRRQLAEEEQLMQKLRQVLVSTFANIGLPFETASSSLCGRAGGARQRQEEHVTDPSLEAYLSRLGQLCQCHSDLTNKVKAALTSSSDNQLTFVLRLNSDLAKVTSN